MINGRKHNYGFTRKEEQDELELGWIDITARNYDPALGRWMNLDPLAELMRRHSPYNYAFNSPIYFMDPDGMMPHEPGPNPVAGIGEGIARSFRSYFGNSSSSNSVNKKTKREFGIGTIGDSESDAYGVRDGLESAKNVSMVDFSRGLEWVFYWFSNGGKKLPGNINRPSPKTSTDGENIGADPKELEGLVGKDSKENNSTSKSKTVGTIEVLDVNDEIAKTTSYSAGRVFSEGSNSSGYEAAVKSSQKALSDVKSLDSIQVYTKEEKTTIKK